MLCYVNGPIYLTGYARAKNDDGKMDLEVSVNYPSYYETNSLNIKSSKNTLESQISDLFIHNIIIDKYARTKVQIVIDVYEASVDITSFAVMATSLALTLANIEQKGIITCANIVTIGDTIIVDPLLDEEQRADFKFVFGSIVDLQENNLFLQFGFISEDLFKKVKIDKLSLGYRNCDKNV